ncbi:hypothetical protein PLANPX_4529 [Lacipirellula parvula]|uniref:Uncharacterized protein n=1 Tax=Lacipirellula parvula TaxID=2650471 RepID=A0A5K7XFU3_9BACT|nr:hypothetical protein PLANPX_4529 [Lacipirellula parvula]
MVGLTNEALNGYDKLLQEAIRILWEASPTPKPVTDTSGRSSSTPLRGRRPLPQILGQGRASIDSSTAA